MSTGSCDAAPWKFKQEVKSMPEGNSSMGELSFNQTYRTGKYTAQRTGHKCPHLYNCTQEKKWNMTRNTERQPLCPLLGATPKKDNY